MRLLLPYPNWRAATTGAPSPEPRGFFFDGVVRVHGADLRG